MLYTCTASPPHGRAHCRALSSLDSAPIGLHTPQHGHGPRCHELTMDAARPARVCGHMRSRCTHSTWLTCSALASARRSLAPLARPACSQARSFRLKRAAAVRSLRCSRAAPIGTHALPRLFTRLCVCAKARSNASCGPMRCLCSTIPLPNAAFALRRPCAVPAPSLCRPCAVPAPSVPSLMQALVGHERGREGRPRPFPEWTGGVYASGGVCLRRARRVPQAGSACACAGDAAGSTRRRPLWAFEAKHPHVRSGLAPLGRRTRVCVSKLAVCAYERTW